MKNSTTRYCAILLSAVLFPLAVVSGSSGGHPVVSTTGFVIKFKENISYAHQKQLLESFSGLQFLEEKENALLPGVSFVRIIENGMTAEKIAAIKKEIEKIEEVVFVNGLITAENGHFSAALGEFYVKLFSKKDLPLLEKMAKNTRTKILGEYRYMPDLFILCADKNSEGNSIEMAKYFSAAGLFRYASANMMFSMEDCSPNDPLYNRQWSIENTGTSVQFSGTPDADMDVDSAWTITAGDSTIKIAVLDSGVDTAHSDLAGNLLPGFDATDTMANNSKGFPNTNYPEDGHGTACAGIIAAVANNSLGVAGVAYNCKVIPIKMFYYISLGGPALPYSTNQWGLDAINWAWQTAGADVMSNSWGIPDSLMGPLQIDTVVSNDALNNAAASGRNGKGVPILFSAGNAPDTFCLWPARTPSTIAVAATTMCDELKTVNDCSPENWASNHGTGLDISAPGVKIATTDITGSKGFAGGNYYLAFNGTSAACPNAAGVMALILSANKNLTAQEARATISYTCEKVGGYSYNTNAAYGTWSMELGYGRVNAYKALQVALGMEKIPAEDDFSFYISRDISGGNYLNYTLKTSSLVRIEIFDLLGRRLRTVFDDKMSPGNYSEELQGINSSGIYLVRIAIDDKIYGSRFLNWE